jgi:hypothetical protein
MGARKRSKDRDKPIKRLLYPELLDLLKLYLSDPTNRDVEEKLAGACIAEIERIVEAYAYQRRFPNLMIDDAISLAQSDLMSGLRELDSPNNLKSWLTKVSRNAAITEFLRNIIGRGAWERVTIPLEVENPEGETVQTLDIKDSREAAQRYGMAASGSLEDFRQQVEKRVLLGRLLKIHMASGKRRDRDSALWVQTILIEGISQGDPIEEIAKIRGTTRADVLHLLKHDSRALCDIYRELCGSAS